MEQMLMLDMTPSGLLGIDTSLPSPYIKAESMHAAIDSAVFGCAAAAGADCGPADGFADAPHGTGDVGLPAASYYGSCNPLYLQDALWPVHALKNPGECSSDTSCVLLESNWAPSATHSGCSGDVSGGSGTQSDSGSESLLAPAAQVAAGARVVSRVRARRPQQKRAAATAAPATAATEEASAPPAHYTPHPAALPTTLLAAAAPEQQKQPQEQQQQPPQKQPNRQPRKRAAEGAAEGQQKQRKPRSQQRCKSAPKEERKTGQNQPLVVLAQQPAWAASKNSLSGPIMPFEIVKSYRVSLPEINAIIRKATTVSVPPARQELKPSA